MTYILTGRLKNSNFLIVDSISSNTNTKQKTFENKLTKLESSENTFFTFTGLQFIDNCIRTYDSWLFQNKRNNDFINSDNSIQQLITVIDKNITNYGGSSKFLLNQNRIFFINKENSVCYDLDYGPDNKLKNSYNKIVLEENDFIESTIFSRKQTFVLDGNTDTFNMAKYYLSRLAPDIDFKDRYSFVELFNDGAYQYISPFKYYSDYIAYANELDYEIIDRKEFIWNI